MLSWSLKVTFYGVCILRNTRWLVLEEPKGFSFWEQLTDGQALPANRWVWQKEGPVWSHFTAFPRRPQGRGPDREVCDTEEKVLARGKSKTMLGSCGHGNPTREAWMSSHTPVRKSVSSKYLLSPEHTKPV